MNLFLQKQKAIIGHSRNLRNADVAIKFTNSSHQDVILEHIEDEKHYSEGGHEYHECKINGHDIKVKFLHRGDHSYEPHFKVNKKNSRPEGLDSGTANRIGIFVLHSLNKFIKNKEPKSLHFISTKPEKLVVYDKLADTLSKRNPGSKIEKVPGGSTGKGKHLGDTHTAIFFNRITSHQ